MKLPPEFEQCEEPQPDFKIVINDKVIGIEHTRLFLPKDSKGNDPVKHHVSSNRIVENAERMFKEKRDEKLTVTVNFSGSYGLSIQTNMLTGKDVKELSKFICDFVLINIPEYGGRRSFEQFNMLLGEQILPDQIDHISIDHKYDCWTQSEGGMVPDIRSDALYSRIASKDSKLKNYNKSLDEVWLLIVENQWNMLSYFDFSYADNIDVNSHFNRVFIMRSGNNEVYECNIDLAVDERWNGKEYLWG
ncbi:MAG: hypothetical protein EOO42_13735 [Flavobacteriales bacterium]|nr:MAG: hypothetical protein EOO42_13735 [Flavobacteriales bacterium]